MFSNILVGAAGFPVADLGDEISRSLRFSGSQTLTNTNISTSGTGNLWTLSLWVKYTDPAQHSTHIFKGDDGGNSTGFISLLSSGSTNLGEITFNFGTGGNGFVPKKKFRDPSAWYHFIVIYNGANQNINVFINGEAVTEDQHGGSTMSTGVRIDQVVFGKSGAKCYLADVHFVDGSAKSKDDFGRNNEAGVWVPKKYADNGTTSHGTNGFHLDFEDSSDPGNDVSGNNNDFTASGFDTADAAIYTGNEAGSGSTYESNASNRTSALINEGSAFDGNTAGGTQVNEAAGGYWYLTKTINNVSGLRILMTGQTSEIADTRVNGSTVTTSVSGNFIVVSSPPSTVNEIAIRRNTGNTQVHQVEVDKGSGFTALLDNFDNDVDYLDTPTSNYSTWNSSTGTGANTSAHTSEGNLTLRGGAGATITKKPKGKTIYFELQTGFVNNGRTWNNWWNVIQLLNGQTGGIDGGGNGVPPSNVTSQGGFAFDISANVFANNTNQQVEINSTNLAADDIIGVQISDTNITITINGTTSSGVNNLAFGNSYDDGMYIYARNASGSSGTSEFLHINFGQRPFIHRPASLSDDNNLQTNTMPEPTIPDGRKHFEVLTWTGDGASPKTRTGLEFTPDLIWIKDRNNNFSIGHRLYDSVRGAGVNKHLDCSRDAEEGEGNDAEFGFVTGFVDGGFTAQAGNQGDDYVNDTSTNYVAWCWKAGGSTTVANTNGTINSNVSANKEAGFSIISFEGNEQPSQSVGHGLDHAPEFVITKKRENAGNWNTNHVGSGASHYLVLNLDDARTSDSNMYNGTTSTVVNIGSYNAINANGEDMIMYAWHSVEGFSKFGAFTGNDLADGPFIYTGFKPSFIIMKAATQGFDWYMWDTKRNTINPAENTLEPSTNASETTASNPVQDIDIFSNGFKPKSGNQINQPGATIIYCAWAEHPFGGENVPPATAR